ncbi:MAG: agmatinase [Chloroflexota bacterium]
MNEKAFFPRRGFVGLEEAYCSFDSAKVVVLPIPYDSTSEWGVGKRQAPQAIIDASQYLELYDPELDAEPYRLGIHTLPELEPVMSGPGPMLERVRGVVCDLLAIGKLVVVLGGEHSLSVGVVRACVESHPKLSVLHLDAHADLRQEYLGTPYSHACVMRRISELCPSVSVGVRSLSYEEHDYYCQNGLHPFSPEEIGEKALAEIVAQLSSEVYITIDLDVFDPSLMPAVTHPEPGGLSWQQVLQVLRAVASTRQVVGFDIMELCPQAGTAAAAYTAAKLAYKLIGYSWLRE